MNIAVLSGKGGTGKTTVAVNLAALLNANYIDCDVEEPNGFIFLKPSDIQSQQVTVAYPVVDKEKCILCGECVQVCQFNALFNTKNEIFVFEKMCHGCKACRIVCRSEAIRFEKRTVGVLEEGIKEGRKCLRGVLDIGEPMAVPVIRQLLEDTPEGLNLLDCSPGTSCNAVNALRYAQGAILVTEPSAFGLHDLKMAVKLVRGFELPFGIVINKWNNNGNFLLEYLQDERIEILGFIPHDRKAAEAYSKGRMLQELSIYQEFNDLADRMKEVFACS
jgi:MinD superfamily P-loop ATPase